MFNLRYCWHYLSSNFDTRKINLDLINDSHLVTAAASTAFHRVLEMTVIRQ